MFLIQYWTAADGWKEWHAQPTNFFQIEPMLQDLRNTRPSYPWRAVQVLDL